MRTSFVAAGVLAWALWLMPGAVGAQTSAQPKGGNDDILIIDEDSGGDDILIIEEDGGGNVEDLQEELDRLADEIDDMRDLFGTLRKNVNVTGYGETHFNVPTDDRINTFDAHRFVVGINARFNDWIFLNAEIDYEHAAQVLEFEMAYLDFLFDPKVNARIGTVLIPVGFLNEFHEPVLFWTVERPVFHNRIVPTSWNGTGGGFFGTLGNFLGGMNYRLYLVNSLRSIQTGPPGTPTACDDGHGRGGDCGRFTGGSGLRSGRNDPDDLKVDDFAVTGRFEFSNLFPGFQLAGSFYTGNTTHGLIPENGRTTLIEGDIKYRYKWFDMNASIANAHVNNAAALNNFAISQANNSGFIASDIFGWNVQFGIHVPQLLGKSTSHDVVVHAMYEFIDTQNNMPTGFAPNTGSGGETDVYTAGVAWFPSTPNVALKADFTHQRYQNGTSRDDFNFGFAYMFF